MTDAVRPEPKSAPPSRPARRPAKPRPGWFGIVFAIGAIALTVVTAADWKYGTGFSIRDAFSKLGNRNPVIEALSDIDWGQMFSPRSRKAFVETMRLAVLSSIAGSIVSIPLAFLCTKLGAPWVAVRAFVRIVSSIIRSIPEVLWASIFVAAVGVGTLAGLLALFFFTIAVVTKLLADTLDGIDFGPVEAAEAAGARRVSMLRTSVFPQVLPAYASYVLYAFELNIRGSAVIGLVGAGGIGSRIQFFQNFNNWEAIWGLVIMFVIVVFIIDRLSTVLRRRLV